MVLRCPSRRRGSSPPPPGSHPATPRLRSRRTLRPKRPPERERSSGRRTIDFIRVPPSPNLDKSPSQQLIASARRSQAEQEARIGRCRPTSSRRSRPASGSSPSTCRRPLGVARLLDRDRLARRDRRARRRLALHRAPALQGHGLAHRAGDRGDLRRPRRGAERRHVARDDARLRPRARRPARAGARRDRRDGLRPVLRRHRLRARRRARGDRDGRRQPAGPRPRRRRGGGLRRPSARAAGDRAAPT